MEWDGRSGACFAPVVIYSNLREDASDLAYFRVMTTDAVAPMLECNFAIYFYQLYLWLSTIRCWLSHINQMIKLSSSNQEHFVFAAGQSRSAGIKRPQQFLQDF
jgi:hypothetical protein